MSTVLVGGTFDEFHKGHETLLHKAFKVSHRVIIGLSSDHLARQLRKNHEIASFEKRLKELRIFLKKFKLSDRTKIVPLDTPYGITLSTTIADGIVVSEETEPRTIDINLKRRMRKLPPLEVVIIAMVRAEDDIPISTTRIRNKEIDREGRLLKS